MIGGMTDQHPSLRIEHVAWQVRDPKAVADWYVEHLGFAVKRHVDNEAQAHFLADGSGKVMIEIYHNPNASVFDYPRLHPLQLHLAFVCDDIAATVKRLTDAGATVFEQIGDGSPDADHLVMLRDPFGFAIQLCRRAEPMV